MADPEPAPPTDVSVTVTGPPNGDPLSNPIVKFRERHWFGPIRTVQARATTTERVELRTYHMRDGDECWDIVLYRDDTVTQNEEQNQQEYEDFEFEGRWDDYINWMHTNSQAHLTLGPGASFGPTGVLELPRFTVDGLGDRDFTRPAKAVRVGTGWGRIGGKPLDDAQRVVMLGPISSEEGARHPCEAGENIDNAPGNGGIVGIEIVDVDTGEPVEGTLTAVSAGLPGTAQPVSAPTGPTDTRRGYRNSYIAQRGAQITITHTPPPGFVVDHNSEGQVPPGELTVTIKDFNLYTFYDKKVPAKTLTPGAGDGGTTPSTPTTPPPPATPGRVPTEPEHSAIPGVREELPLGEPAAVAVPAIATIETADTPNGLPWWAWALTAVVVVAILAVLGVVVFGDGGGENTKSTAGKSEHGTGASPPSAVASDALFMLPADPTTWLATGSFTGWTPSAPRTYTQSTLRFASTEAQGIADTLGWSRAVGFTLQNPMPSATGPAQLFVDIDLFGSAPNAHAAVQRIFANFSALGTGTMKTVTAGRNQFFTYQLTAQPVVFELGILVAGDGVLSISTQLDNPTPAIVSTTMSGIGGVLDQARSLAEHAK